MAIFEVVALVIVALVVVSDVPENPGAFKLLDTYKFVIVALVPVAFIKFVPVALLVVA